MKYSDRDCPFDIVTNCLDRQASKNAGESVFDYSEFVDYSTDKKHNKRLEKKLENKNPRRIDVKELYDCLKI